MLQLCGPKELASQGAGLCSWGGIIKLALLFREIAVILPMFGQLKPVCLGDAVIRLRLNS